MVNFKPGEYMRKMFIQLMTQVTQKKIRILPTGVEPRTLPPIDISVLAVGKTFVT